MTDHNRLGQMLMEAGFLQESQVDECLKEGQREGISLSRVLTRYDYVTEAQVVSILSDQLGIPLFQFDDYSLMPDLGIFLSDEVARQYQIIPLEDGIFSFLCAVVEPLEGQQVERIERAIGKPVDFVICTPSQFDKIYETIYGSGLNDQLLDILEEEGDEFEPDISESLSEHNLELVAAETPVVKTVNWILAKGVQEGASDIHISPERASISLRMRIDGHLKEFKAPPRRMLLALISRIKIMSKMDISLSNVPQDGRFSIKLNKKEVNFRVSCLPTVNGENVVLRILSMDAQHLDLEKLGFDEQDQLKIIETMKKPQGMFLTTGPTGSGKSTTLYSLLKMMNQADVNIITTEDPVEYRMSGIRQVELNPKAGMTFAAALRSILRQDPDVVMVGEIRDVETANMAVRAAMTGHKVLSTLHTNSSVETIGRLIDLGVQPFLLASVLHVVVSQRLLRRICSSCCATYDPSPEMVRQMGMDPEKIEGGHFVKAVGCSECGGTGYRGRVGIYEVLFINDDIRQIIIKGGSAIDIRDKALECGGLCLLKDSAFQKAYQGLTTLEEAYSKIMG